MRLLALLTACADDVPTAEGTDPPPTEPAVSTGDTAPPIDPIYTGPTHPGLVEWVALPGGTYRMGSDPPEGVEIEWPSHDVTLAAFELGRTEITVSQYEVCVHDGVCDPIEWTDLCHGEDPEDDGLVQACLDWYDAELFCAYVGARLPTEAEWEYAARGAGRDVEYPWGDEAPDCDHVVMDGCGVQGGAVKVQWPCRPPLGATPHGVCDMAGNAFEWALDWYYDGYASASPTGEPPAEPSGFKVMRGGGVGSGALLRTRTRTFHSPDFSYGGMGGRCAR